MARKIEARTQVSLLLYTTINLAAFTAAVYAVMLWPMLNENAGFWLTAIMAASLVVAAPVAWCLGSWLPSVWWEKMVAEPSPLSKAPTRPH
jgi:hypothetical protein